ncbi:hypothetical protein IHE45_05G011400 [Dioscorea alata]|uniref:Uncharacterized protein n=1 Tax=Dioscorea alata TaxID=55571 RepID=A0ACB7VZF8_DIOAL|nr:hypothetical protein IHE45_05G011400 [Dioscorea alata]
MHDDLLKRRKVDDDVRDGMILVYLLDHDTTIFAKFWKIGNIEKMWFLEYETLVVLESQVTRNMNPRSQFRGYKEDETWLEELRNDNSCGSLQNEMELTLDAMTTTINQLFLETEH